MAPQLSRLAAASACQRKFPVEIPRLWAQPVAPLTLQGMVSMCPLIEAGVCTSSRSSRVPAGTAKGFRRTRDIDYALDGVVPNLPSPHNDAPENLISVSVSAPSTGAPTIY